MKKRLHDAEELFPELSQLTKDILKTADEMSELFELSYLVYDNCNHIFSGDEWYWGVEQSFLIGVAAEREDKQYACLYIQGDYSIKEIIISYS